MLTQFGKVVRKLRIDINTKLMDMANDLQVTPSYLSAVEMGKKELTTDTLNKSVDFFKKRGVFPKDISELMQAGTKTQKAVRINLELLPVADRSLAVAFARKLPYLNSQEKAQLNKLFE